MAGRMFVLVKPGGHIFFRESGDRNSNREPRLYTNKVFRECQTLNGSANSYKLSMVGCICIEAYVKKNKRKQNLICKIWQKDSLENDKDLQRFLDNVLYKSTWILRYERVFGEGYMSPGGVETTKELVAKLELKPGQKVLNVGCGTGGADFYMAENFYVHVVGIDLSVNMISLAMRRAIGLKCSVEFEVADCTTKTYPDNSFDVIYSRDAIVHIPEKPALFRKFFKWLKPGGKLLITDFCRSSETPSPEFAEYIERKRYDLHDVQAYGKMLKDAGFEDVIAEDRTDQFAQALRREVEKVEKEKEEYISDFSQEEYNEVVRACTAMLRRTASGEQTWGLFIANKK